MQTANKTHFNQGRRWGSASEVVPHSIHILQTRICPHTRIHVSISYEHIMHTEIGREGGRKEERKILFIAVIKQTDQEQLMEEFILAYNFWGIRIYPGRIRKLRITFPSHTGSNMEWGQGYKLSKPAPTDVLPPARLHLFKNLQAPQTPPTGDQVLK